MGIYNAKRNQSEKMYLVKDMMHQHNRFYQVSNWNASNYAV